MSPLNADSNSIYNRIEYEPDGGKALINPADTLLLLLDHQAGTGRQVPVMSALVNMSTPQKKEKQ